MYELIGIRIILLIFGGLFVLISVPYASLSGQTSLFDILFFSLSLLSPITLAVIFLGESPLFPRLCEVKFVRKTFPPISGSWTGEVGSNWHIVRRLLNESETVAEPDRLIPFSVDIRARLFSINIKLKTDTNYSRSHTIKVKPERIPGDGGLRLYYIYMNETIDPKPTDTTIHYGAAIIELEADRKGMPEQFSGFYWTSRNWEKGLNTAGKISLRRP